MSRRRTLRDDRREPQFGYQNRHEQPSFNDPRANPSQRNVRGRHKRSLLPIFAVGAALILFAGFLWVSYMKGPKLVNGQLPTITADTTPIKVKPDNPGGTEIPFQDTTVYDDLNQGKQKHPAQEIEHLLAPPEQPITAQPVITPAPDAATGSRLAPPAETAKIAEAPAQTEPAPAAPAPVASQEDASPAMTPENEAVLAPAEPAPAPAAKLLPPPVAVATPSSPPTIATTVATPKSVPKPKSAPPATGPRNSIIQLGSFQDEDAAKGEWQRLKSRYSAQLSSFTPIIQRVDLAEKGIWYRLRIGPLTADKAKTTCTPLIQAKAPCIVSTH